MNLRRPRNYQKSSETVYGMPGKDAKVLIDAVVAIKRERRYLESQSLFVMIQKQWMGVFADNYNKREF